MALPDIRKIDVKGKKVFLRADLDVPLSEVRGQRSEDGSQKTENREIEDDTRLVAALPTIHYLLKNGSKVIVGGHLGRPERKYPILNRSVDMQDIQYQISNEDRKLSLGPVADWVSKKMANGIHSTTLPAGRKGSGQEWQMANLGGFQGWEIIQNLFLLENLRFYEGEEKNNSDFSKKLASLADIYVNDAFAMCHRNHASVTGITHFLPHYAGIHLQEEVEKLGSVLKNPGEPLVVLIGGKKIETKLPLILKMHKIADYVLVGGKIAQEVGILVKEQHKRIIGKKSVLLIGNSNEEKSDITQKDCENFLQIINIARTIVWNGSMGILGTKKEEKESEKGTRIIAEGIVKTDAYKIAGGGDTIEFLQKIGLMEKFDFVSTGGGAMLSFLSGEKLPGLEALIK